MLLHVVEPDNTQTKQKEKQKSNTTQNGTKTHLSKNQNSNSINKNCITQNEKKKRENESDSNHLYFHTFMRISHRILPPPSLLAPHAIYVENLELKKKNHWRPFL